MPSASPWPRSKTLSPTPGRISNHAGNLADLSPELAGLDFDVDDEDDANIEALSFGEKIKIDLGDLDIERPWQRDLWNDRETLRELLGEMRKVSPDHDLKLRKLKQLIQDKAQNPINDVGNRKVLVFLPSPTPLTTSTGNSPPRSPPPGSIRPSSPVAAFTARRQLWARASTSSRSCRCSRPAPSSATSPCRP